MKKALAAAAAAPTWLLFLLLLLTNLSSSTPATDALFSNQSLTDGGETLVSSSLTFAFGFFSPVNSTNRYLGIWFNRIPVQTVVWIANRDSPMNDASGLLKLLSNGNLVLLNRSSSGVVWSSGTTGVGNLVLQLLDSGNLVLIQGNDTVAWQSFDQPTDTLLPGMKLGMDMAGDVNRHLTSWRAAGDPSTGNYSLKIDPRDSREAVLWDRSGQMLRRVELASNGVFNFSFVSDQDGTYLTYSLKDQSAVALLLLDPSGEVRRTVWVEQPPAWKTLEGICDGVSPCGPFAVCSPETYPVCSCLSGFYPVSPIWWGDGSGTEGCVRMPQLHCVGSGARQALRLSSMVLPSSMVNSTTSFTMSLGNCSVSCLSDCSCTAYASAVAIGGGSGCIMWFGDLTQLKKSTDGALGQDLYVIEAAGPSSPLGMYELENLVSTSYDDSEPAVGDTPEEPALEIEFPSGTEE